VARPVDLERRWRDLRHFGMACDPPVDRPHHRLWKQLERGPLPLSNKVEQVERLLAESGGLEAFEAWAAHLEKVAARWRR